MNSRLPIVFISNYPLPAHEECDAQMLGFVKRFTAVHANVALKFKPPADVGDLNDLSVPCEYDLVVS